MKKFIFTSVLALTGMVAVAQSNYLLPDGLLAIELQANPFSNDFNTFKMGELKARLFLDNKSVVRIGIGIGIDNDKDENGNTYDTRLQNPDNYTIETESKSVKTNQFMLKLSAGYEYHFANAGRLDFYAGAEAGYEAMFYSGTSNTSSNSSTVRTYGSQVSETTTTSYTNLDYSKMTPGDNPKYNKNSLFANLFTGVDFYVYKGLYIGTELGISFKTGKEKNGYYTEVKGSKSIQGANTTVDWVENYSSETGIRNHLNNLTKTVETTVNAVNDHSASSTKLKIYVEPAIRIGWLF